ncbi:FecR family protein [Stieleria sp. TO1_6]|uniref:FecR family protein n=1 Tax=Stieleria tagensis TaxID=2956795 RepID=UPI00209B944C|nr:FecR family protein [Stieleria tagensis]MCO8124333.1 FecR family protein [Stieleria tagensis]
MNPNNERWQHYRQLCDAVLDGTADRDQQTEFEALILADPDMKRDYVQLLHLESTLRLRSGRGLSPVEQEFNVAAERSAANAPVQVDSPDPMSKPIAAGGWQRIALAATVLVALGLWSGRWWGGQPVIATMGTTDSCKWVSSDLPTNVGAALTPGRLILDSGIAELRFPKVDLRMEGPADLELISSSRCRVRAGRVYAEVKAGGEGFVVETPTSVLTDRGTRFGVNVGPGGDSDLTVLEGRVDAQHLASGVVQTVHPASGLRLTAGLTEPLQQTPQMSPAVAKTRTDDDSLRVVQLSTAVGQGRDGYVIAGQEESETDASGMLLVKRPPVNEGQEHWRRVACLHFDLTLLDRSTIRSARLRLQGLPSGLGYLSLTPDTTIAVYGLTDQSLEDWSAETLDWKHCPGIQVQPFQVDRQKTQLLGKFLVPSDHTAGVFGIEGDSLVQFLQADRNGGATLILVSETAGQGASYVHGFASSQNAELPPPTLRLGVAD